MQFNMQGQTLNIATRGSLTHTVIPDIYDLCREKTRIFYLVTFMGDGYYLINDSTNKMVCLGVLTYT